MPGAGRLGDNSNVEADAHACPACPHPSIGPAISGSPDINVDGRPALRVSDTGVHAACCGPNTWEAIEGSDSVFFDGKPAHRIGDSDRHCGGVGELIEGSGDVIIGGGKTSVGHVVGYASNAESTPVGDPVDVATGRSFTAATDLIFAGPLPVKLVRSWRSDFASRRGLFGAGWSSLLDMSVSFGPNEETLVVVDEEGRSLELKAPAIDSSCFDQAEKLLVVRQRNAIALTAAGRTSWFTFAEGAPLARVTAISDERSNRIRFWYKHGQLYRATDSTGKIYQFAMDASGRLLAIRRMATRVAAELILRAYSYDARGRLNQVTDELQHTTTYQWDDSDRMVAWTNRNGYTFHFEYEASGRCVRTFGEDRLFYRELRYDTIGRKTHVTNSLGACTTYFWNEAGLVTQKVGPLGETTKYGYDRSRNLVYEEDANGYRARYRYDGQGRRTTRIDPENRRWKTQYVNGFATDVDPLGHRISQVYDPREGMLRVQAENGERIWAAPLRKTYLFDEWGRAIQETDALGASSRFEYDVQGKLTRDWNANGGCSIHAFDAEERLLSSTDPAGSERRYHRHGFNGVLKETDGNGNSIEFEFNTEGKLTQLRNELKETHRFEYDRSDRLIGDCAFDGVAHTWTLDPAGRITAVTSSDGTVTTCCYDRAGRLTSVRGTIEGGDSLELTFVHDAAGRLIEATSAYGAVTFEADSLGRIVHEHQRGRRVTSTYLRSGALATRTGPFGTLARFRYDGEHQLCAIDLPGGRWIRFLRDKAGRPVERELSNGVRSRCSHDAMSHLLSQEIECADGSTIRRSYRYDLTGRLVHRVDDGAYDTYYEYDPGSRLSRVTRPNGRIEELRYDAAGNLLNPSGPQARYGAGNRLLSVGSTEFLYDPRGNLVEKRDPTGVRRYRYNAFNQLVEFTTAGGIGVEFRYDALGRRTHKIIAGEATVHYYWDQFQLIGECDGSNSVEYIYYPHQPVPIACVQNGQFYFYQTDHLGTPMEMVDDSGRVVWRGRYDVHGLCDETGQLGLNPLRFQGQYHDAETGLHFNVFRYYDPELGRYLTQDPKSYLGNDYNLYRYARSDPINVVDPTGLGTVAIGAGIGSVFPGPGTLIGAGIGLIVMGGIAIYAATRSEPTYEEKTCPPCPAPPPNEIDKVPPGRPHHPCPGDHWHYYEYHQNPKTCQCFGPYRKFGGCL